MKNYKIIMTILLAFVGILFLSNIANAGWVNGYYKSNGTYVNGYYRSDPNGLKYDNYSWNTGDAYYNDSYYDSGYSDNWYEPSWEWQDDYYTGLNSYTNKHDSYDSYNSYDYGWSW